MDQEAKSMSRFAKIRALHLVKKKVFLICLSIELALLIAGIIGLFGKNNIYEYDVEDMTSNFGTYSEQQGGIVTDGSDGDVGEMVSFTGFVLPRGTYTVQLFYITDTDSLNSCMVQDNGLAAGILQTNGAYLFSGLDHTDFDMWLYQNSQDLAVHVNYGGTGMLAVQGLRILRNNASERMTLFWLFCSCTLVNLWYCYVQYDRAYHISVRAKRVSFGLGLIILFSSLPLMVDYVVGSGDLIYHLMRVEGVKDGILSGQFPVRISPEWIQSNGYASPIFYGETLLYPLTIFRLIGFTVTDSYRLIVFVITVATVLIAYFSFRKIFGDAYVGLFCSALYSLSVFRIHRTYIKSAWGECFGIMLLPLIFYGVWRIYTQGVEEKSYKRSWVPLGVGFALLFQSHLLSCEITVFFLVILCCVLWRKTFCPRTFLVLVKAVVFSVLLSAWFMVPFVDYMLTGDFVIHHVSGRTIQSRGLFPVHLFLTFFRGGGNVFFDSNGMADSAPIGVGSVLVTALVLLALLFFTGKSREMKKEERALGAIAGIFSVMAMIMSLRLFPWDRIQALSSITAVLVSSLQIPDRLLCIAVVCLTAVAGVLMKYLMTDVDKWKVKAYAVGMISLAAVSALFLQEDILNRMPPLRIYNNEGMGTGYISGAEYLPYGTNAGLLTYHDPLCSGELQVYDYERLPLGAKAYLINSGNETESAVFALLSYKGYRAYGENGQVLNCYSGDNSRVTVDVPAGYDGEVTVRFVIPLYWRVAELVSCVTLAALVFLHLRNRRRMPGVREIT